MEIASHRHGQDQRSSWFSPSLHNRTRDQDYNPDQDTQKQSSINLGGGKKGRNPNMETTISLSGGEVFVMCIRLLVYIQCHVSLPGVNLFASP